MAARVQTEGSVAREREWSSFFTSPPAFAFRREQSCWGRKPSGRQVVVSGGVNMHGVKNRGAKAGWRWCGGHVELYAMSQGKGLEMLVEAV